MSLVDGLFGQLEQLVQSLANQLLGSVLTGLLGKRSLNLSLQDSLAFLNNFQTYLQGSAANLLGNLQGIFSGFQTQINQFLTNLSIIPQSRATLKVAADRAKGDIDAAFRDFFSDAWAWIQQQAANATNVVLAAALNLFTGKRGLLDGFGDIWASLTATLGGHIDNITSTVVDLGTQLWGSVTPHLQDLQDQLTNHALNAGQSLLDSLASISQTLQG